MKRILLIGATAILLLLVALGALYWQFVSRFETAPPDIAYPPAATPLDAQRQDLDHFARLIELDLAYTDATRAAARQKIAQLRSIQDVLAPERFRMELRSIIALADNGHTQLRANKGGQPNVASFRVYDFAGAFHVVHADSANKELLGARLVAVNGRPVEEASRVLQPYVGGHAGWRRFAATALLISPAALYGAGLGDDPKHAQFGFESRAGETMLRTLEGVVPHDDAPWPAGSVWLAAATSESEKTVRVPLLREGLAMPFTLAQRSLPFRKTWLDDCVLYLQLRSNRDEAGHSISAFLDAARDDMERRAPCAVIFDLRFNGGGDYTTTASFARDLPSLVSPKGHVFLLTGIETFSAGITTAAFVKEAGGDRVKILGEPVGDRLAIWSEGNRGCLPHAPLCVKYTRARHDYSASCTDLATCFWLNYLFPVRVRDLAPDEIVRWTFSDLLAGRDPVLNRALLRAREDQGAAPAEI